MRRVNTSGNAPRFLSNYPLYRQRAASQLILIGKETAGGGQRSVTAIDSRVKANR